MEEDKNDVMVDARTRENLPGRAGGKTEGDLPVSPV